MEYKNTTGLLTVYKHFEMCINKNMCVDCFLMIIPWFVSEGQVSLWLKHSKPIATRIYLGHPCIPVTQLQIKIGQHHENKPEEQRDKNKNRVDEETLQLSFLKFYAAVSL